VYISILGGRKQEMGDARATRCWMRGTVPICCAELGQSPAVLKKMRVCARAEKSLESATECGKVDAGRATPRESYVGTSQSCIVGCLLLAVVAVKES
jgi:hypothetical protein